MPAPWPAACRPQEAATLKYQVFQKLYIIFQPVKLPPDPNVAGGDIQLIK